MPIQYLESQIGVAAHPSRRPLRGLLRMRSNLLKHNNLMLRSERRERLEAWAASDSPISHSQYYSALNATPMRLSLTQATRHGRLAILPDIRRLNSPGMPTGLATSSWAPVSEMLRTTQSMVPPLNSMVPAFKVRCRGAARLFSRLRSSSGFGCPSGFNGCTSASFSACRDATAMSSSVSPALILVQAILNRSWQSLKLIAGPRSFAVGGCP